MAAIAAVGLAYAAPAAGAAEWAAHWIGQSGDLRTAAEGPLEEGEIRSAWLKAQNTGTSTWQRKSGAEGVKLGTITEGGADSGSPLAAPDWLGVNRPTRLKEELVLPGEVGTFEFNLRAPAAGSYKQYFGAVNEGVAWMGVGEGWYMPVDVVKSEPPSVQFTEAPERLAAGEPAHVAAHATDNVAVKTVRFSVRHGDQIVASQAVDAQPFAASLATEGLAPGQYTLRAEAEDRAGKTAAATRALVLDPKPAQPAAPQPPLAPPSLGAINARLNVDWLLKRGRLQSVKARVLDVPAGAVVSLRYGKLRERVVGSSRGTTVALKRLRKRRLRAGSVIEVTVTKPGMVGRRIRWTVARRPTVAKPWGKRKEACIPVSCTL